MSEERVAVAGESLESSRHTLLTKLIEQISKQAEQLNAKQESKSNLRWFIGWSPALKEFDVTCELSFWPIGTPCFISKMDAMKVLVVCAEKLGTLAAPSTEN